MISLRKSALINTYAPGSILDYRSKHSPLSCVVNTANNWEESRAIYEPRLAVLLGVHSFREPPVNSKSNTQDGLSVTVTQFPTWLQCPSCKRIAQLRQWQSLSLTTLDRYCPNCSTAKKVFCVPVRFVVACQGGHLDDFPWHRYVRHKDSCSQGANRIVLRLINRGSGLGSIFVHCDECSSERSMREAFTQHGLRDSGCRCWSSQPWIIDSPNRSTSDRCEFPLKALQRGSSSLYFTNTKSALSIPPWTEEVIELIAPDWEQLVNMSKEELSVFIGILSRSNTTTIGRAMRKTGISVSQLVDMVQSRKDGLESLSEAKLLYDEYTVLKARCHKNEVSTSTSNFIAEAREVPLFAKNIISGIAKVKKLREVQALCSFSRINPSSDKRYTQRVVAENKNWLPAVENYGEGIFLDLSTDLLREWESDAEVIDRVGRATAPLLNALRQAGRDITELEQLCNPRFFMLHTLAHCLIRGMANLCGYSAASIKERIYSLSPVNSPQMEPPSGILLYTASSDSDGTLGGLASLAEPAQLEILIMESLKSSRWCSSDPLCLNRRSDTFLTGSLASCHNCTLVPETTCGYFNRFLDRALLYGDPEGRLRPYLEEIMYLLV